MLLIAAVFVTLMCVFTIFAIRSVLVKSILSAAALTINTQTSAPKLFLLLNLLATRLLLMVFALLILHSFLYKLRDQLKAGG